MLTLAEKYDVVIVEDDIYGDFETMPSPRLAAFDGFERVHADRRLFEDRLAALRVSYLAGRADWVEAIVDLKLATTLGNSAFAASAIHAFLIEGGFRRHLDSLRPRLAARDRARRRTAQGAGRDALGRAAGRHVRLGRTARWA